MTANVAQVFLTDDEWSATLRACGAACVGGLAGVRDRDHSPGVGGVDTELTRTVVDVLTSAR